MAMKEVVFTKPLMSADDIGHDPHLREEVVAHLRELGVEGLVTFDLGAYTDQPDQMVIVARGYAPVKKKAAAKKA